MRPIIPFACACALLIASGCSNPRGNTENPTNVTIAPLVDSLLSTMPNAMNNDITRKAFADTIAAHVNKYKGGKLPFLSELPVTFHYSEPFGKRQFETFDFAPDKNAGRVFVQFIYKEDYPDRGLGFSIITALDTEQAANLVDGRQYIIDGTFAGLPNNTDNVFYLPGGTLARNITTVSIESGLPLIMLGNFIMDNVTFTEYQ